jgi:hypothetical protein
LPKLAESASVRPREEPCGTSQQIEPIGRQIDNRFCEFEPGRFADMLVSGGFEVRKQWLEPTDRFLLVLAEAV